ncbi:hypothetical protein [Nocardia salmonicida]|uniref:hypothetical protein n=1 Tax=Nocardia salmonicida TaxID=53431 RepID=UPI003CEA435A
MSETGTVQVDRHQFLLSTIDADPTDVTAEGTLIWTGPGFVCVLTGIVQWPGHPDPRLHRRYRTPIRRLGSNRGNRHRDRFTAAGDESRR